MSNPVDRERDLPLGEAIERQLAQDRLEDAQLQELMAMQRAVLAPATDNQGTATRRWRAPLAAACALLLAGVLAFWQVLGPSGPDRAEQIALEVAKNHLKLKPLDVAASDMGEIQAFFTQLDFSPVQSSLLEERFRLTRSSMLGGRYCSISGVTAAQLRYGEADRDLHTLYQVAYDVDVFGHIPSIERGETPRVLTLKGLRVTLWVEKGLLMVLVGRA